MEIPANSNSARTLILYHGNCPDGFGGAYAAWKKFGDTAEYIPVRYGKPVPENLAGAKIYFVDFCYDQPTMDAIVAEAASVTVLDHHTGTQAVVESMPEHVFDNDHSGATIAWEFFHGGEHFEDPAEPTPELLAYVEDDDLFRFKLADTRAVLSYLAVNPYEFEAWDALVNTLKDPQGREKFLTKARTYAEYFELLAKFSVDHAKMVSFEGYETAFATAHPLIPMKSLVGMLLSRKYPPIALVVTAHPEGFGVSIRGDGSVDVSAIARKYGGNGHYSSAGFSVQVGDPMPWKIVEDLDKTD
jgi:nanoRNase/pAp phosphatase (c-di-AMP/oligoRNAs hydrolase)